MSAGSSNTGSTQSTLPANVLLPANPIQAAPIGQPIIAQPMAGGVHPVIHKMPIKGCREAPRFDKNEPLSLDRYWTDLEKLFRMSGVSDIQEKKEFAQYYLKPEDAYLWSTIPEYADPAVDWDAYKKAINGCFPGLAGDQFCTRSDLELLARVTAPKIKTQVDLGEFYRHFKIRSHFLVEKNRLSTIEQGRLFFEYLPPALQAAISQYLMTKMPDHFPEDPYTLEEYCNAAVMRLRGTSSAVSVVKSIPIEIKNGNHSTFLPTGTDFIRLPLQDPNQEQKIKTKDALANFAKTVQNISNTLQQSLGNLSHSNQLNGNPNHIPIKRAIDYPRGNTSCIFCNEAGHIIRHCMVADQMVNDGYCKRDNGGRIVLPNGGYVPGSLSGDSLKAKIIEWHQANPNNQIQTGNNQGSIQPTASQMMHSVVSDDEISSGFSLTKTEIKDKLYNQILKLDPTDTYAFTRQKRKAGDPEPIESDAAKKKPRTTEPPKEPIVEIPEHPFRYRRDAAPPQNNPVAQEISNQTDQAKIVAYRKDAPIHDNKLTKEVFRRMLQSKFEITHEELLSLSPELREQYKTSISNKRIPKENDKTVSSLENALTEKEVAQINTNQIVNTFLVTTREPIDGSNFISYADSLPNYPMGFLKNKPEKDQDNIVVAKDSYSLRAVRPLVDNSTYIKCILDPGCQIVAMSQETAHRLGLSYNPKVTLKMQSANGEINPSLGLIQNVSFSFGVVTLYLQVHVIQTDAYDVLLGRPFDMLTTSTVTNYLNQEQSITITDPNTGDMATIPTLPRSNFPPKIVNQDLIGANMLKQVLTKNLPQKIGEEIVDQEMNIFPQTDVFEAGFC